MTEAENLVKLTSNEEPKTFWSAPRKRWAWTKKVDNKSFLFANLDNDPVVSGQTSGVVLKNLQNAFRAIWHV